MSDPLDWLAGGGEMGELIRSIDWSATPLGPVQSWPQSLRTFSPIRDESGGVGGLFHPITEVTEKMLSERRTHGLRRRCRGARPPQTDAFAPLSVGRS